MKFKKLSMTLAAGAMILAMSANVMAAGSITGSVDTNNVTANTTVDTTDRVGDKASLETEAIGVTLSEVTDGMYEEELQKQVEALNNAPAESTVLDAFLSVFSEEDLPVIDLYNEEGLLEEKMDLSEFKFLSPVMDLKLEKEPTEEEPVEVTFTVNNLTDNIEVFVLHFCADHNWEMLETEETSDNQITASFHSASPVALIYREKPAEEAEADTEKVAP